MIMYSPKYYANYVATTKSCHPKPKLLNLAKF